MEIRPVSYPFFIKATCVLIGLIALGYIVILGKEIFAPLILAFLFAVLLLPFNHFLEHRLKLPRTIACFICLLTLVAGIGGLFYLIGSQISELVQEWPQFQDQLSDSIVDFQRWIKKKFHINASEQMNYVHSTTKQFMESGTAVFGATVSSLSSVLLFSVFTFLYTFLFLLYRKLIISFLVSVFKEENSAVVFEIVEQVQFMIRKYVLGLLTEMVIIAVVICSAFLILGIKYAVLLGLITGVFNVIPYVGILTAAFLSILITFATTGLLSKVILVMVVVFIMHLIDANILLPVIVGSRVKINAFITVIGIVVGEMLWGISGMFFSIPTLAIVKIIFDRIEDLKPWGLLLGEDEQTKKEMDQKKSVIEKGKLH